MTQGTPNRAASIRQRLLNLARQRGEDFQQILGRFALERLMYRLTQLPYAVHFVLKGALLFHLWFDLPHRATRDADFLGTGSADPHHLANVFRTLTGITLSDFEDDGLVFLADTVTAAPIRREVGYPGVRITLQALLTEARIPLQCDIGFGDAITPAPVRRTFPTLLDLPPAILKAYPPETVIAEKLEAMVKLGTFNSRLKDYYDLWLLQKFESLDNRVLPEAIARTFERRGTALPETLPSGLSADFVARNQPAWEAFLNRNHLKAPPLEVVVAELGAFYWPMLQKAAIHP